MWVYRDQSRTADVASTLKDFRACWGAQMNRKIPEHEGSVDLLVRAGELESALVDCIAPGRDTCSALTSSLRCITMSCAHLFRAAWRAREPEPHLLRGSETGRAFAFLQRAEFPKSVQLRTPEGYAFYSLYPEMYLQAAEAFSLSVGPAPALCLGLRSIGTSLSAVVAAELEAHGSAVRTDTLRPRGDPWDRTLRVDRALRRAWNSWLGGFCLVVDEGPGLSGSSFAGTALAMEHIGFSPSRITLFPSWEPQAWQLRAEKAQAAWPLYRKIHVPFESIWLDEGRLYPGALHDLSAGTWRKLFYVNPGSAPAVNPYHERRKYLGTESEEGPFIKFVGIGSHGLPRFRRAETLSDTGLTPRVRGWRNGFLYMDRVSGVPLKPQAAPDYELLEALVNYIGVLHQRFQTTDAPPFERHLELIHQNLGRHVGLHRGRCLNRFRSLVEEGGSTQVDSRMLPHEWLRTPKGYVKTDVTDHHDDHFYPGDDHLTWDVAGARVEFGFSAGASRWLSEWTGKAIGDPALARRLPFYTVAYLAYRIGYATLAAETLGESSDAHRFRRLLRFYRRSEAVAWAELEQACRWKRRH